MVAAYSQGKYKAANYHFEKAIAVEWEPTSCASIATATASRVLYGIGRAHAMLRRVYGHVLKATEPCLDLMLEWKDIKRDNFLLRTPTQSTTSLFHSCVSRSADSTWWNILWLVCHTELFGKYGRAAQEPSQNIARRVFLT